MGHLATLFWLFTSTSIATTTSGNECCQRKCWGADIYNFIHTSSDTSKVNCDSNCVYEKENEPQSRYCFKAGGDQISVCSSMRERQNLTDLMWNNPEDYNALINALMEAKKPGTYKGPPIKGVSDENPLHYDSSYNAATSFHGYPGLCAGPGAVAGSPNDPPGGCCIHGYSTFLPWHRLFMIQLEDSLRAIPGYAHVTLPYWDFTQNFTTLPYLVNNPTLPHPVDLAPTNKSNPFYHSVIPGKGKFTKRSPKDLIQYTKHHCISGSKNCYNTTQSWPGLSVLMDLTLTALEEREYEAFEKLIELPHNMVHNQLGFVANPPHTLDDCKKNSSLCYPYTMQVTNYASYDPIFLPFHAMVDYQWAVHQALQEYRNISYEEDCHPGFKADLLPFSRADINNNPCTRAYSRGIDVVDYKKNLLYKYDKLMLNGMNISTLDDFLNKRNEKDRLFAGFSLPNIRIEKMEFDVCLQNTSCYPIPLPISKIHKNREVFPGVYRDLNLLYVEVTRYLPHIGLRPDQNLRFQIVTSSISKNITYNPVSIFRKAGSNKDLITIYWPESPYQFNFTYAPSFKVRQARNSTLRFLLENGTQAVIQYKDREAFEKCTGGTLVDKEIDTIDTIENYFQNPLDPSNCNQDNKIIVDRINTCKWGEFHRQDNGNASIGWQIDMSNYTDGICMEPGTFLTLYWRRGYHGVVNRTKDEYENCSVKDDDGYGFRAAPNETTFPHNEAFSPNDVGKTLYIICPVGAGSHCMDGMKLKICVEQSCLGKNDCHLN